MVDTLTVVQPSAMNNQYFDCGMSLLLGGGVGGGCMREIKIPQEDFVLKMQGGGGGLFAGHYSTFIVSGLHHSVSSTKIIFIQCVTSLCFL